MTTVLVFERHAVHPDAVERFVRLISERLELMRASPGLLWADAAEATDDRPSWIVLSEWRTAADAEAWAADPRAASLDEDADTLVRSEPTRRLFSPRRD